MNSLFFLAHHWNLSLPDGAGYRAQSILRCLNRVFPKITVIQKGLFFVSIYGKVVCKFSFLSSNSKILTGILSLFLGTHYIQTKHIGWLTKIIIMFTCKRLNSDIFYVHFLWSYPSISSYTKRKILLIDTHNYDPDWWDNMEASSKWLWEKHLCRISKKRIFEIFKQLPKNTILVHVSKEDSEKYRLHRPDLTHLILPNGCNLQSRTSRPDYTYPKKRLYFLGALNLQITRDAILHFDKTLWPQFSSLCEFHLIGSGPTAFWKLFCAERGWHLHNNVPDDDLTQLLEGMHYLVLPFTYGAGSKLKFIDACARGIPVISTPPGVCGFSNLPPTVRISEDPSVWAKWISSSQGPTQAETSACLDFANEYSWDNLVAKVWPQIQNHPPVP
jgi:hypothetical protein